MGREIMRVAETFLFPVNESYADHVHRQHLVCCTCTKEEIDDEGHVYPSWRETVPVGNCWQLWQTVSDGPISPVFATAEDLVDWMCLPDTRPGFDGYQPWGQGYERKQAEALVRLGSVPSLVIQNGRALSPVELLAATQKKT